MQKTIAAKQGYTLISYGAAEQLGVPYEKVSTWAREGRLPFLWMGQARFFRQKDLERFVEECMVPVTASREK